MSCSQKVVGCLVLSVFFTLCFPVWNMSLGPQSFSSSGMALAAGEETYLQESFEKEQVTVSDPLEDMNRAFFQFNDKFYFWVLKPTSKVYATFIPEGLRIAIRNAFHNFAMPIRLINCALQGKGEAMGTELGRFFINSTLGVGGLIDFAYNEYGLKPQDEDTGQTFGTWGMEPVIYLTLPLLGPSSIRDGLGLGVDTVLSPTFWLIPDWIISAGVKTGKEVNNTSLRLGEYEDFKQSALDPYVSMRDAYIQYRDEQIKR